ncbi:EpsG family protein [uncultured Clostridium sp.]|uniref:EpsG family protein n=1 Tax=uncultured Clostridium sp. TaxID=59620 RepID=UPI002625341D|nr:EpsG family protein [uncultured Clostridium sp.]
MEIFKSIEENLLTVIMFWSIFLFSILIAWIYQKKRVTYSSEGNIVIKKIDKVTDFLWVLIIIIGPSLLIGLRAYDVGADTSNYVNSYLNIEYYNSALENFKLSGMDRPLFWLLRHIVYILSNANATIFLCVMAILTLFILVKGMQKWIDKYSLPSMLFIYYCIFGMQLINQSRQMLALSIFFYSLYYLFQNKNKKYLLCILLAGLIHYTAFIGIIIYFLRFNDNGYLKFKQNIIYLIVISMPIIIPFILPIIISVLSKVLPRSYRVYLNNITYTEIGWGLFLTIFPIVISIILYKKYLRCYFGQYLIRISVLAIIFRVAAYYSYFLMRMSYYGVIVVILITELIGSKFKLRSNKIIVKGSLYIVFMAYYILNYMHLYKDVFFPYYSIL